MSIKFLSRDDLLERGIDYSPSQLNRKMRDGTFPSAIKGAGKQIRWLDTEIDQYQTDLLAARSRTAVSRGSQAA